LGFDQYHEPANELSQSVRTFARMMASLIEEAEAINWYEQRISKEKDAEARAIMKNAQKEEFKHFGMNLEFLLRKKKEWRTELKEILFSTGSIVKRGEAGEKKVDWTARIPPASTTLMFAAAMPMITQDFYDATVANSPMAAFADHAYKFLTERFKFFKPNFHLIELGARDWISRRTTCFRIICQNQQLPDFIDAKPQFSPVANKPEPFDILRPKNTVPAFRTAEWANEADILIIADGLHFGRSYHGEFTYSNIEHENTSWISSG
jgi:uncharacterized protein